MRARLIAISVMFLATHAHAQANDQTSREIAAMHWTPASGFKLQASKSSIVSLPGFQLISDAEARRLREIIDGRSDPAQEAEAFNVNANSELLYEWYLSGYIKGDDWADVDADNFLEQLKSKDAEANKIRAEKGIPSLTTTGWRQQPRLNQDTHTVTWSIEGVSSNGDKIVNSIALKLGRYGFEKIIWIIDPAHVGDKNDLLLAVNNHSFENGARYVDYVAGTDHAAEYGIAGLVAGVIGVKLLKGAGILALLLGLKKFVILLFLPFIYAWRKIVGMFRKPDVRPNGETEL